MNKRTIVRPAITDVEIAFINELIANNPTWGRTRLSKELCLIWNWCDHNGNPKDISCRDMLRKLDAKEQICLPKAKNKSRQAGSRDIIQLQLHDTSEITCSIKDVLPVRIEIIKARTPQANEFKSLMAQYHYLGFDMTIGENIKYMVYSRQGQLLACLLFGSSAWSCAPRDTFIGWSPTARQKSLTYTTNNIRFLILPWVQITHLASHILGRVCRRISTDWQDKYGHSVYLLETFVEKNRFKGTCYKAANWINVGETTGRSRNDRYTSLHVPIKDIYLFPLSTAFREVLCHANLS
ncbi:MAG: DUF4338 domain-containing protein [Syntrophomonas sp.]|nr:DUF4338 domain-containing protein [Syntrophomonas sp.]